MKLQCKEGCLIDYIGVIINNFDSFTGIDFGRAFAGFFLAFVLIVIVFFVIAIAVGICFVLTVQKSLRLTFKYHGMNPGFAWLLFVPFFNLAWNFVIVSRISTGTKGKMAELGKECGDAAWGVGLTWAILSACGLLAWVPGITWPLPVITVPASLLGLVMFVIYWVKIAGFNKVMASDNPSPGFTIPEGEQGRRITFCTRCGSQNNIESHYCGACGAQLQ